MAMQYTLRNVPPGIDRALRRKAEEERKSLNQVVIEVLQKALGLESQPIQYRDLGDVAGTWVDDPEFDAALEDQRQIDHELWR